MKEWTIMVYMAGDNNLSENMALALEGLEVSRGEFSRMGKQEKVNLLAYFDGSSLTAPTHYIDYSDGETYKHPVQKADKVFPKEIIKSPFGEEDDSASAYSILNFVNWCLETRERKAENYALIFSAHSFGFHGTSFLRDETSGNFMTLFKFRWALNEINRNFLEEGKKIAILGFDSCVMSMLEVGYELKDVAQTMVASEGSLPNSGWGYAPMLKNFVSSFNEEGIIYKDTEEYVKRAASGFVESFIEQYKNLAIGGRSVDIAAWDLEKVEAIAENVNSLAKELNTYLDLEEKINSISSETKENSLTNRDITVYQDLKKIILQSHYDCQTYMKEQCVDLKDFCQRLIIECKFMEKSENADVFSSIIGKCKNIILAIDACVLKCGYSGEEYQFSNGISLYFPWTHLTYFLTSYRYRWLLFNRGFDAKGNPNKDMENPLGVGTDWNKFLRNYVGRVTNRELRKYNEKQFSMLNDFTKDNPVWSKDNPVWSKDNPVWSKDNPRWSKDNPVWSKDNPVWSKDNPVWSKGEVGEYLFYFGRFKNFQLSWNIYGFTDEVKFDDDFK